LYFESIESGQPISIGEAREKWPNVRVKQSTLAGWQGQSLSIEGVELRNTYTEIKNNFLYRPHNEKYVVGGEVNTLFFGPNAAYYSGGSNEYIKNNSKWVRINDVENKNEWIYVEKNIIKIGLTVSENIKYDNGEKNWIRKVTHINGRSRVEKELFFFDSGSKLIIDYDPLNSHEYYIKKQWFDRNQKIFKTEVEYESGATVRKNLNLTNYGEWSFKESSFISDENLIYSKVKNKNNYSSEINWQEITRLEGSNGQENVLLGDLASNYIVGGDGKDFIDGNGGIDALVGMKGADMYIVRNGLEFIFELADGGNDTVISSVDYIAPENIENIILSGSAIFSNGNEEDNKITGNDENNTLYGLDGNDLLFGKIGQDILHGGQGNDRLYGQLGEDILSGGDGNDWLVGNAGADRLTGGKGADTFRYQSIFDSGRTTNLADTIFDFSSTDRDKIDISEIDANLITYGNQEFKFIGHNKFDAPGQIRVFYTTDETRIICNIDSNVNSFEFLIRLSGNHEFSNIDFIL
jgi:Ca2+-binding RTX toxin-like protein